MSSERKLHDIARRVEHKDVGSKMVPLDAVGKLLAEINQLDRAVTFLRKRNRQNLRAVLSSVHGVVRRECLKHRFMFTPEGHMLKDEAP